MYPNSLTNFTKFEIEISWVLTKLHFQKSDHAPLTQPLCSQLYRFISVFRLHQFETHAIRQALLDLLLILYLVHWYSFLGCKLASHVIWLLPIHFCFQLYQVLHALLSLATMGKFITKYISFIFIDLIESSSFDLSHYDYRTSPVPLEFMFKMITIFTVQVHYVYPAIQLRPNSLGIHVRCKPKSSL